MRVFQERTSSNKVSHCTMTDAQEEGAHCELVVGVQVVMEVRIRIGQG